MKTLYKFKEKIYTYTELVTLYSHSRVNKKIAFNEWFENNLSNGNIVNYTEKKDNLTLYEVIDYAYLHDLNSNQVHFQDNHGKCFTILDAEIGSIGIDGENRIFTFEELENDYKENKVFNICK